MIVDRTKRLLKDLFEAEGELTRKTIKGGFWVFFSYSTEKILGAIRTIILARLLIPSDFGLMGIATVALGAIMVFTNLGLDPALIHKKDVNKDVLDTGWVLTILRGIILALILFFAAPYIAIFYENPVLELILRIISLTLFFNGLRNIGIILLQKEMDFRRRTYYNLSTAFLTAIVTISLAFILRSVWALVIGHLAGEVIGLIASYIFHPFRPRIRFSWKEAKGLLGYGKYVLGAGALAFIITQGDDALVGKVLGMSALGFYTMAYYLSNIPAVNFATVLTQVTLPAFSKVQDEISSLRRGYFRSLNFVALLVFPMSAGILILAPQIVNVLFGEKWMPMVPAMRVLCIFGVTRAIVNTYGPIVYSVGRPDIAFKVECVQLILLAILIYPMTVKWGIVGTAWSTVIPKILVQFMLVKKVAEIMQCRPREILKPIFFFLIGAALMSVELVLFHIFIYECTGILCLIVYIILGIFFYIGNVWLLNSVFNYRIKDKLRGISNIKG